MTYSKTIQQRLLFFWSIPKIHQRDEKQFSFSTREVIYAGDTYTVLVFIFSVFILMCGEDLNFYEHLSAYNDDVYQNF